MEVKSSVLKDKDITLVVIDGRIDSYTYGYFENEMITNVDIGQTKLILDFEKLSYIGSQGLKTLLYVIKKTKSKNGFLKFINVNKEVKKILKFSGLLPILKIYSNLEEALK